MKSLDKYRFTGSSKFSIEDFDTSDTGEFDDREEAVDEFVKNLREINKLQQKLYAERKEGVIFIFQAMDAAGKDGVIRTVFSTLSPHGVKEYCFKVPSAEESSHDYLWRFWSALPPRGNISIFNRSYYEDVLVGKVHKLYENQTRPDRLKRVDVIRQRYSQIKDYERYLYNTGTRVVKVFLNVSKDEQARRFISRIDTPKKNWKVSSGDISEREYWDEYMEAFETMVNTTSTKNSPWYVVPSDHKWYSRLVVSRIVLQTLQDMDPKYPVIESDELEEAKQMRQALVESIENYREEEEEPSEEFTKTGDIAAEILLDEEQQKITEKKEKLRDNGFRAVQELLAKGCILKSAEDIVSAVAEAGDSDEDSAEAFAGELLDADNQTWEVDSLERKAILADAYERFGLYPAVKLSGREKEFLETVESLELSGERADFYSVCNLMDIRPSKLDEIISAAVMKEIADIDDDSCFSVTESGLKSLYFSKKDRKEEKKFKRFLKCLSVGELEDFLELCDGFVAGNGTGESDEYPVFGDTEDPYYPEEEQTEETES